MKIIVAAIEYNTPNLIDLFINEWVNVECVVKIYIGSTTLNKSSSQFQLFNIVNNIEIYYIDLLNNGYGVALDTLINLIKVDIEFDFNDINYLFIGNIDVYPIKIDVPDYLNDQSKVPIINIIENGRNRNPFLSILQKRFIFLFKLPLIFNSFKVLLCIILIMKFLKLFKSKPWSVHGAFFCFNMNMLKVDKPFFNNSFLYCEELFFARNLENLNIELVKSEISVNHIGGVSTTYIISSKNQSFFKFWKQSMKEYFYLKRSI